MTRDDLKTAGWATLLAVGMTVIMLVSGCSNNKTASLAQTLFDEQNRWSGGDGGSP